MATTAAPKFNYPLLPIETARSQLGSVGVSGVVESVLAYTRSLSLDESETPPLLLLAALVMNTLRHRKHCPFINGRGSAIPAVIHELKTICVLWRTGKPDSQHAWRRHWMFDVMSGGRALLEGGLPDGGEAEATALARAAWEELRKELCMEEIPGCPESFTMSDAEAVASSSEMFSSALTSRSLRQRAAAEASAASALAKLKEEADARMRVLQSRSAESPTPTAAPSKNSAESTKPTPAPPSNSSVARAKATWRRRKTGSPDTSNVSAPSATEEQSGKSA